MTRTAPDRIKNELQNWKNQVRVLRFVHVFLGITAIIASLLVAAKINSLDTDLIEWFAFTAAVSTGLLTGLGLGSKSNRMRTGWRILNAAVIQYEEDEAYSKDVLFSKFREAEEVIGDVKEDFRA